MSSEKRFPISEFKREKLRRAGVIPISPEVATFGLVFSLGASCLFVGSEIFQPGGEFQKFFTEDFSSGNFVADLLALYQSTFLALYLSLVLLLLFVVLVLELVQSRFLWAKKVFFSQVGGRSGLFDFSWFQAIFKAILFIFWLGIVFVLFTYVLEVLGNSQTMFSEMLTSNFGGQNTDELKGGVWKSNLAPLYKYLIAQVLVIWQILLVGSFFIAALYRFLAVLNFDKTHRMSREEVEREAKEYEVNPDLRRAQKESLA